MEKYTCPCCGYKTLDTEHLWDICEVCFWEDDPVQFIDPDCTNGPNDISLREAQKNFEMFGACDKASSGIVREPAPGDERDASWKPL